MPQGLVRFQQTGQSHFVTFSCFRRQPRLTGGKLCDLFLDSLERLRRTRGFRVYGYVLMPEHVHLLVSEPERGLLGGALQALKISVARLANEGGALWQRRYYDRNVRSDEEFAEKLRYIHRNPVVRGLCARPEDWPWSSFRHYLTAEVGAVEIESQWTADRRAGREPRPLKLSVA
jgi:putative transposase